MEQYGEMSVRLAAAEVKLDNLAVEEAPEADRAYFDDLKKGDVLRNQWLPGKYYVIKILPDAGVLLSSHSGGKGNGRESKGSMQSASGVYSRSTGIRQSRNTFGGTRTIFDLCSK